MATRDDAQTSFRLSSRLLERTRVLGDTLGVAGQSEVIRIALEAGVKQLEDALIVGKVTIAAATLEALVALRPALESTMRTSITQANDVIPRRDPAGCRVVWLDAVAKVRAAIAAEKDDMAVVRVEGEVSRMTVGRLPQIEGSSGWATLALRELVGAERWQRIHVIESPKAIPGLIVGYWYEQERDVPIAPPPFIPTGAYLPHKDDAQRGLDFIAHNDVWLPLSHAATFTYSHSTGLERGRNQFFVTWPEHGQHVQRVVGLNRVPPSLIPSQYGRDASTLARKDYDAIELVFDKM